jgi:hypothetical protein
MSDEFDKRDWAEDLNDGIRNRDTWFRGLKIVVLLLFLAIARFALLVTVAYQFCFCLVRNRPSEIMLPVGRWLALYVEKSILFMTWNSDHAPFPFTHFNRVMEQDSYYQDEASSFQAADEDFAGEEEPYIPEPPAPPTTDDEAEDTPDTVEQESDETGEEPEEEDKPGQPPRPDA